MYSIDEIYSTTLQLVGQVVTGNVNLAAILFAISALLLTAAIFWLTFRNLVVSIVTGAILAVLAFNISRLDLPKKVDTIGHEIANKAINSGVDTARKSQATELQYIHAVIKQYGIDEQKCQRTVNYHDFCTSNTSYYTTREINPRPIYRTECDSKGNNCQSVYDHTDYDDEYTPWFTSVVRYWVVPDTKTKYLHEGIYTMEPTIPNDTNSNPRVYISPNWRAPENALAHIYQRERPGSFNDHVPEIWARVRNSAQKGGAVVVGNFVGKYFHWAAAAESSQFAVYDGQYQQLKKLVSLPSPTGVKFDYKDAFERPAQMKTLLTAKDGELAMDYPEVFTVGLNLNPDLLAMLNSKAMEAQGHLGPNKEASFRWFLVSDAIVNQLGGLRQMTYALKAYMNDESVWGLFKLPKNQVIMVTSVNANSQITGRDMETGMPDGFGNTLVKQRIRLSIDPGQTLPLTVENLFGKFSDRYSAADASTYEYSPLSNAGAALSLIYESKPGYKPPDPNSDECLTAPPEHLGFIRYSMCTQQYLGSTIRVNKDGADLIFAQAQKEADSKTSPILGWIAAVISAGIAGGVIFYGMQNQ